MKPDYSPEKLVNIRDAAPNLLDACVAALVCIAD